MLRNPTMINRIIPIRKGNDFVSKRYVYIIERMNIPERIHISLVWHVIINYIILNIVPEPINNKPLINNA